MTNALSEGGGQVGHKTENSMRAVSLIGACLIVLWMPAHAATIEQDIAEAEKLNGLCRGSSGDLATTDRHCKKRDAAYSAIEKRGWCWGTKGKPATSANGRGATGLPNRPNLSPTARPFLP